MVATACLDLVRPAAEAKHLALSIAVLPGTRVELVTDPTGPEPLNSTRRHIQLPKLMAADELRRQHRPDHAELDDEIVDELDRADQIA